MNENTTIKVIIHGLCSQGARKGRSLHRIATLVGKNLLLLYLEAIYFRHVETRVLCNKVMSGMGTL
jgi:hypothetical protein